MPKVLILVEGQTEETFVKRTLDPHLSSLDVFVVPTIIATKRIKSGPSFKGGVPQYERVRKDIQRLLGDTSAALVTTMIDYYGLPKMLSRQIRGAGLDCPTKGPVRGSRSRGRHRSREVSTVLLLTRVRGPVGTQPLLDSQQAVSRQRTLWHEPRMNVDH